MCYWSTYWIDTSQETQFGLMCFPSGTAVKNLPASAEDAGDRGSIPGLGRSPGEGNGNPFQYSCLENLMDRRPGRLQSMGLQRAGYDLSTKQQCFSWSGVSFCEQSCEPK